MKVSTLLFFFIAIVLFSSCTSKQEKITKYQKEGTDRLRIGDNKAAIEDFTNIISLDTANYEAYYYRGNAKFNLKEGKEALLDYNESIKLKPDYADAYYNRALCKQFMNDKDGACIDWHKSLALGKHNVSDLLNICK